jgi:hydroxymethylbilane synthase
MKMKDKKSIYIGTRSSALALWQARWVMSQLTERYPGLKVEFVPIKTKGDRITDSPLSKVGGKGLFVKEIEDALLDGRVDLAVHSMKDVPTELPDGLELTAITNREDPRDALVAREVGSLKELPKGARLGTSSLRRKAQLLHLRSDLVILDLRGNLDTRYRKLQSEGLDAIVVAMAGTKRLGLDARVTEILSTDTILPAVGQGALGIESRRDDLETKALLAFLNHPESSLSVLSERAFLRVLQGGCQVPIGAYGKVEGNEFRIRGLVADLEGKRVLIEALSGPLEEADELGKRLADNILKMGGRDILEEIYGKQIETLST